MKSTVLRESTAGKSSTTVRVLRILDSAELLRIGLFQPPVGVRVNAHLHTQITSDIFSQMYIMADILTTGRPECRDENPALP